MNDRHVGHSGPCVRVLALCIWASTYGCASKGEPEDGFAPAAAPPAPACIGQEVVGRSATFVVRPCQQPKLHPAEEATPASVKRPAPPAPSAVPVRPP